jgi:hypothetical protein
LDVQLPISLDKTLVTEDVLRDHAFAGHGLLILGHLLEIVTHFAVVGFQLENLALENAAFLHNALGHLFDHLL